MWQNLIVIVAVGAAALYVIWALAPNSLRRWLVVRWGGRFAWLARRIDRGGCADCAARSDTRSSR